MADLVRSLDISGPRSGSCNSNSCMKLSFEELEKSMHVCERVAFPARSVPSPSSAKPQNGLRRTRGGRTVRPNDFRSQRGGASHEFRHVRQAKRMAEPRAGVHEDACPPRGADL